MRLLYRLLLQVLILTLVSCVTADSQVESEQQAAEDADEISTEKLPDMSEKYSWTTRYNPAESIYMRIHLPKGYSRVDLKKDSFGEWLRFLPLKNKEEKVHLYNDDLKSSQWVHHAVIDIDVGKKDLQQCADAVMRMRAEYLYNGKAFDRIHFNYTSGDRIDFQKWANGMRPVVKGNAVNWVTSSGNNSSYPSFRKYIDNIFMYAGTASLSKEMNSIDFVQMQPGDVLIQGGHPGHAVLVLDMAINSEGEKLYMLAQSYMPAQDFHILVNSNDDEISPWYRLNEADGSVNTPEWSFSTSDLKCFTN